jgi:hypothetical protein
MVYSIEYAKLDIPQRRDTTVNQSTVLHSDCGESPTAHLGGGGNVPYRKIEHAISLDRPRQSS